jgi:hypothetical protein
MAAALLVTAGAGAWYSLLGGTVLRVAPLGAVVVLVAARRLSPRQGGALLALWFPAAVLAAGVPADRLLPHAWPSVLARLSTGAQRLTASQGALITNQPWPLAAWLLLIGVVWVAGTALAASNPRSARRRILGFGILTAPWIAAVLLSTVGASLTHPSGGWHGATILLAGLLWATAGRVAIRPALALGMAAALISVGVAQAAGPRGRWFSPGPQTGSALQFRTLQTEPTYGPLQGRRSGSAMLEITASQPALWRMRVLILFAGPAGASATHPASYPSRRGASSRPPSGSAGCATTCWSPPGGSSPSTPGPRHIPRRAKHGSSHLHPTVATPTRPKPAWYMPPPNNWEARRRRPTSASRCTPA